MSREAEKQRAVLLLGSFFLPAGIFFSVLIFQGFFPNGTKTTLFMDLKGQYTEFLASLRYIFHGDDTLFFSWSRAMGGNALGLYAYYTGGILSFLSCIFPVSKIWLAVEILEILEVGLCGLSFAIFLEWGVKKKTESFGVIIFSACYALMSYNMVYTCCFMWIDGCIMLPLIMLGIEKIFQGKKGLLFYIFLSVAMISNYYTAYMICIFSVFYVLFRCTRYLCEQ
ncbi:MAG: YfhO family protein [Lachnospiraceae bacterium]|nr:YfhO family protein [Lachnospiraceae bacterium]